MTFERFLLCVLSGAVVYIGINYKLLEKRIYMADQVLAHDLDAVKLVLEQMQK